MSLHLSKKKLLTASLISFLGVFFLTSMFFVFSKGKTRNVSNNVSTLLVSESDEKDGYDEAAARDKFEFDRIKDPALGYVPMERMFNAINYTESQKQILRNSRNSPNSPLGILSWTERGPIYDLVGASGNTRGGVNNYTSGRTAAILIDTLNDPTGNTVFCGAIAGGLWKCTNFLSAIPSWIHINDRFDNLAISSICQDPSTPAVMYFCTGEATSNVDAVYGGGVWKSTNGGGSWIKLSTSTGFLRGFKIVCDASGNVYLANRNTNPPSSSASGLYRSKDGGGSWQNITPVPLTSTNNIPTDIEYSTTGKLHVSFGYLGTTVQHVYTADPANVTTTIGTNPTDWKASTGIRTSATAAVRLELATQGDILYGITVNPSPNYNADSCYKSIDGGATWTKQNTTTFPAGILNSQGWYNITLAINPLNSAEFIIGGLDAYKSTNSGVTIPTRMTFWVTSSPYVHADHHFMQWWTAGAESRIVIGCDGGVFYSNDAAVTFADKNRNLAIKQFYGGSIHPTAGSPYLIAGAQDNGVHQLTNPGLSFSTEVTGGDGCLTHINQQNPQIQFGSYVFNQYRRSTDGGTNWASVNFSTTAGSFVNPWDYDDGQNILYGSFGANSMIRWTNANTSTSASLVTISTLASTPTVFKVSPYTPDRVYIGGTGRLMRLDNARTVTSATAAANSTNLTGAGFPTGGNLSCINVGSSDNFLVAVFSNFGIAHVFYSRNGGTSWTVMDGTNLPDMPVRWALFDPQNDTRIFLATEAGVYSTDAVNGASTVWNPDINFPTVRTDMLQLRLSDNTVVAATHGRGLYTAVIPANPEIRFSTAAQPITESTSGISGCKPYKDYSVDVSAVAPPTGDATVTYSIKAGNTAAEGIDFDYTTNGSFTTPSKQQVFTNGIATTKNITFRIYDDAAIEPDETFTITFAVSGATNAYAGSFNVYTVTIKDNDLAPVVHVDPVLYSVGTNTVSVGGVNGASTFESDQLKHRTQILIRAAELTALGVTAGDITSITTRVITKNSTHPFKGYTIAMGNTTATNLSSSYVDGLTQVYTGDYSSVVGDNVFVCGTGAGSAPFFTWDGTSNIAIQFCFDNTPGPSDALPDVMEGSNPFGVGGAATNYATIYSNGGVNPGCTLAAAFINNNRINVKLLKGIVGNPVETALNASISSHFSPNDDVLFYNSNGNIIARIKNLSGSDYACTQVSVDRAGTGATVFYNNSNANKLMDKTFRVVPTTNNPAGQYQITLYYTAAEKAGWEAATGNSFANIQMIKVAGQIKDVTPANPNGGGAISIVTPTVGTFGPDYTLTATFSNGFSGFGAGIPAAPLPVTLMEFKGNLQNASAVLQWSTSFEFNSKNYDIEKSVDGVNFFKIGSVNAGRYSVIVSTYGFIDTKLSPVNYYRLRINDMDDHSSLSNVVLIKYNESKQNVWVLSNPFNNYIDLRVAKDATQSKFELINAAGAVVARKVMTNSVGFIHWQLPGNLSAGTYVLRSVIDGTSFTNKLIKQ